MDRGWLAQERPWKAEGQAFSVAQVEHGYRVRLGDRDIDLDMAEGGRLEGWCRWEGRVAPFAVAREGKRAHVWVDGHAFVFMLEDRPPRRGPALSQAAAGLAAQVPGKVLQILAREGERVEAGQRMAIIESMKMEFIVRAPAAGLVRRIRVGAGDQVVAGTPLIDMEDL